MLQTLVDKSSAIRNIETSKGAGQCPRGVVSGIPAAWAGWIDIGLINLPQNIRAKLIISVSPQPWRSAVEQKSKSLAE